MNERQKTILNLITKNESMEVVELSRLLGVSQVTIRKDLNKLEDAGMIKREHGYARLNGLDNISTRLSYHYEEKEKIARKAIELVRDGETLMIESGSCCALVAKALALHKKNMTIITNSAFICDYVKNMDINLILLGGSYQKESQVLVGPLTSQAASSFYVDHYFIGTDGYTDVTDFTGRDFERCMTVREISRHAKNVIVVSESEKFGKQGTVNLLRASEVSAVVTDSSLPLEYETTLTDQGVEIYKAE